MPTFTYAALDAGGRETSGMLDAPSATDAAEELTRRGLIPIRTELSSSGINSSTSAALVALKPADLVNFTRQLATLLGATLPLDQALRLVAAQNSGNRAGPYARQVADAVTAGRPLSDAMAAQARDLPPYIPALIRAGEARGTPAAALQTLATSLERRIALRARVRGALIYPAILIVVALLAVAVVMGVLVPTLLPLFKDVGRPPPAALAVADAVAQTLSAYWPVGLGALGLAIVGVRALWRSPKFRIKTDGVILRMPVIGPLIADTNVATFARTFGTLLTHGVPLVDAMRHTATVVENRRYRASVEAAAERVKEGSTLVAAFEHDRVLPDLALRFIAIGEQSSRVDIMLGHLADTADAESTRRLDGALTLLSPLLTLVIGVIIGGLILSVMQAILSVNDLAVR
jgi:general secretion pathway protein F